MTTGTVGSTAAQKTLIDVSEKWMGGRNWKPQMVLEARTTKADILSWYSQELHES